MFKGSFWQSGELVSVFVYTFLLRADSGGPELPERFSKCVILPLDWIAKYVTSLLLDHINYLDECDWQMLDLPRTEKLAYWLKYNQLSEFNKLVAVMVWSVLFIGRKITSQEKSIKSFSIINEHHLNNIYKVS